MRRLCILLIALLVLTNAAWIVFWFAPRGAPADGVSPVPESSRASDREEIRALRTRIAELEGPPPEQGGATSGATADRTGRRSSPVSRGPAGGGPPRDAPLSREVRTQAGKLRQTWVADAQQITDPAKRDRTLATVKAALAGAEPAEYLGAIWTLNWLHSLEFDRASFRPLVRHFLTHEDPAVRRDALRAYASVGGGQDGLADMQARLDDTDPKVRVAGAEAILRASDWVLENEAADAYLKLLADDDYRVVESALGNLQYWKSMSPELEYRLIELATEDRGHSSTQAMVVISRAPRKSERMVDVLITVLSETDYNARHPAYQGLQQGVPELERRRVADAVVAVIEEVGGINDHISCMQILNICADETHLAPIRKFLDNPMLADSTREHLSRYLVRIEKRLERE